MGIKVKLRERPKLRGRDYGPLVDELFTSPYMLVVGTVCAALGMAIGGYHTGSSVLYAFVAAIILTGVGRIALYWSFHRNRKTHGLSNRRARQWMARYTFGGVVYSAVLAFWCYFSAAVLGDPFAMFSSYIITMATLISVCSRNYPVERLVNLQVIIFALGLGIGLAVKGGLYTMLAVMFGLFMVLVMRLADGHRAKLFTGIREKARADKAHNQCVTTLDNVPYGICMWDSNGRMELSNSLLRRSVNRDAHSLDKLSLVEATELGCEYMKVSPSDRKRIGDCLAAAAEGKESAVTFTTNRQAQAILKMIAKPMGDGSIITTFENMSRQLEAQAQLDRMSRLDGLTGLINRSSLPETIARQLGFRRIDQQCAVMIISLDRFKPINEALGFQMGDALLQQVTERLQAVVGDAGECARYGGDEFAIVMRKRECRDFACTIANQVIATLREPFGVQSAALRIGATVGISVGANDYDTAEAMLKQADLALCWAKKEARGSYRVFDERMSQELTERRELEEDLRYAIAKGELETYYQPLVTATNPRISNFEALVRWNHPRRGRISPNVFIPLAEEANLISDIGEWVLRDACQACIKWPKDIGVSVNLSTAQFREGDLISVVHDALRASGLEPRRLGLEITESLMMADIDAVVERLNAFKAMGIQISLDDFGTGYSSLSYVNSLPLDKVKIDRSFVDGLEPGSKSMSLLRTIATMGQELGMSVVVEGVEEAGQLSILLEQCCVSEVQGFYFAKPMPEKEVTELLTGPPAQLHDMLDRMKLIEKPDDAKRAVA